MRLVCVIGLFVVVGCAPQPQITVMTVPKSPPSQKGDERKVRTLAALLPNGKGGAWTVKVMGPFQAVTDLEKEFDQFLSTLRIDASGTLVYAAPANWKPGPSNPRRIVTFLAGESSQQVYISSVDSILVLQNINRWRGEVGLDPITDDQLKSQIREFPFGDEKATRVDLIGPGGVTPMNRQR